MQEQIRNLLRRSCVLATVVIVMVLVGPLALAQCTCGSCWLGALMPAPVGTYSHQWQCGQIRAVNNVIEIHECDWVAHSSELSPFFRRYLVSRLNNYQNCTGQILIEPSEKQSLDEKRISAVMDYLTRQSLSIPFESIVVGYPSRDRLRGDDAIRVLDNFGYQQTRTQSSQFNPYIGYSAPTGGYGPFPNRGTVVPAVGGIFTR